MIFNGINIPEVLNTAIDEGQLVIFAGSGVSRNEPANLPNFNGLCYQIGKLFAKDFNEKTDQCDVFLGQLEDENKPIRKYVENILNPPEINPAELHTSILRVFKSASKVRIVTTNFDNLFSRALRGGIYKEPVDHYYAPALPLGHNFKGIVHLHGGFDANDLDRLVLTDKDFGKAYLTEGWAASFIRGLFREYTILFIGYSHADVVMQYIAKGLTQETKERTFSITDDSSTEHWNRLHISPIIFHKDEFDILNNAIHLWANHIQSDILNHFSRIHSIVAGVSDAKILLSEDESTFIDYVLLHKHLRDNLLKQINGRRWLFWFKEKGYFNPLFDNNTILDSIHLDIGEWFIDKFIMSSPVDGINVYFQCGQSINPFFLERIFHRICFWSPLPEPEIVAKWLFIVFKHRSISSHGFLDLELLFPKFNFPDFAEIVVLILDSILKPTIKLNKSYTEQENDECRVDVFSKEKISFTVEYWDKFCVPHLNFLAIPLIPVLQNHIALSSRLLKVTNKATPGYDRFSHGRNLIDRHDPDYQDFCDIAALVDCACDCVEYIAENDGHLLHSYCLQWLRTENQLLLRLSLHGLLKSSSIDDNSIAKLIKAFVPVLDLSCEPEFRKLLRSLYPRFDSNNRKIIIQAIMLADCIYSISDKEPHTIDNIRFDLVSLVLHSYPECEHAKEAKSILLGKYPDHKEPNNLDNHVTKYEVTYGSKSPKTGDELKVMPVQELVDYVTTFEDSSPINDSRRALYTELANICKKNTPLAVEIITTLIAATHSENNGEIISCIISGVEKELSNETDFIQILELISANNFAKSIPYVVALFLKECSSTSKNLLTELSIEYADKIAFDIYDLFIETSFNNTDIQGISLQFALNCPMGVVTFYLFNSIWFHRKRAGNNWNGFPADFRTRFTKAVTLSSDFARLVRLVLCSQLPYVYEKDNQWSNEYLIPEFNWNNDQLSAYAWSGFLYWSRITHNIYPVLLPHIIKTFSKMGLLDSRKRFVEHLASVAIFVEPNPLQKGWLSEFLDIAEPDDIAILMGYIGDFIKKENPDRLRVIWVTWLRQLLINRTEANPKKANEDEITSVLLWFCHLKPMLDDFLQIVSTFPATHVSKINYQLYGLEKEDFIKEYPVQTVEYLLILLKGIPSNTDAQFPIGYTMRKVFLQIDKQTVPLAKWQVLREELLRITAISQHDCDG